MFKKEREFCNWEYNNRVSNYHAYNNALVTHFFRSFFVVVGNLNRWF